MRGGEEARRAFEEAGAVLSGHYELTSGRHSDTYVQCARVLEDPSLTLTFAETLAEAVGETEIDLVVAPAVGGIVIGFAMAEVLGTSFVFAERVGGEMTLRRGFGVPRGARVLIVEDVVTTGGSVAEVARLIEEAEGVVVGVAALVDRGGPKRFVHRLWSALELEVDSWEPSECVLCAAGEPVDSPGSRRLSE